MSINYDKVINEEVKPKQSLPLTQGEVKKPSLPIGERQAVKYGETIEDRLKKMSRSEIITEMSNK